jgi:hypothetical protein
LPGDLGQGAECVYCISMLSFSVEPKELEARHQQLPEDIRSPDLSAAMHASTAGFWPFNLRSKQELCHDKFLRRSDNNTRPSLAQETMGVSQRVCAGLDSSTGLRCWEVRSGAHDQPVRVLFSFEYRLVKGIQLNSSPAGLHSSKAYGRSKKQRPDAPMRSCAASQGAMSY